MRLYPTLVVEGTDLACWYRAGEYVPLTLEEAVDQTAWLANFEDRDISVIRVGLHAEASLEQSCMQDRFILRSARWFTRGYGESACWTCWIKEIAGKKCWKFSFGLKCFPKR